MNKPSIADEVVSKKLALLSCILIYARAAKADFVFFSLEDLALCSACFFFPFTINKSINRKDWENYISIVAGALHLK
jgi:hypothetical protein